VPADTPDTAASVGAPEAPANGTTTEKPTKRESTETPLLIPDIDAARLAGVSRATWHRLRAAGKLPPAVKLGRKVLWRRAEIEEWIRSGCPDAATWRAMEAARSRRRVS
jgi:excisionase family DNA binding protein